MNQELPIKHMKKKIYKDKNRKVIKLHDICVEDIYTLMGEKIGKILLRIVNHKGTSHKQVIADNGGTGYITKGGFAPLGKENPYLRIIGYNYKAKKLK